MRKYGRLLAILSALGLPAAAADSAAHAHHAWARATAPGAANGGVFMRLDNPGPADDRLLQARSERAARAELHTHRIEGGIARMREVPAIEVPAGKGVELKPGLMHVMLVGLSRPLKEGETFRLTLQFEKAGLQTVEVVVGGVAASGHASGHAGAHGR